MANTPSKAGQVVSVALDGATAFDLCAYLGTGAGVALKKLLFYPNAANDVITVREGAANGPPLWKVKDTAGGGRDIDFHGHLIMRPYVKGDEAPAGSMLSFIFE